MRPSTTDLTSVLTGSFSRRLWADVFQGSERQAQDVPLTEWQVDYDLSAQVKASGSATVVHQSVAGESWTPDGMDGVLSPFKSRLLLTVEVYTDDGFSEKIVLGWFRITGIPSADDSYVDTPQGRVVTASTVKLEFRSLDENVRRRGFRSPEQIPDTSSVYTELRRITGMPVVSSLPDKVIPKALVYETNEGGRLKGVQDLFTLLGGVGVVDSSGAWTVVPNTFGSSVGQLPLGALGTVTDVGYSVDTDPVINVVVGTAEGPDRKPLFYPAIATGWLDPAGLYGENTAYYDSQTATTQAQLATETEAYLKSQIGGLTYEIPVQCIFNPLYEMGDVLDVTGYSKPITGRANKLSLSDSALMNVTLEVQRTF
ncbi:hypothetical protein ASE16_03485 [Leifsonia sp. Root227]|uniref:hypothetical protein n=1 Tax=Leifsonia sp. Root227 TaxID=1736496 RepID=UPI0006F37A4D|nr:hypothetical protein [Leifsonia sp. Root227]KRC52123.1 hypothetical protein ASE16_03485 [Leifsonia sp. Root227]